MKSTVTESQSMIPHCAFFISGLFAFRPADLMNQKGNRRNHHDQFGDRLGMDHALEAEQLIEQQ